MARLFFILLAFSVFVQAPVSFAGPKGGAAQDGPSSGGGSNGDDREDRES